jgi:hypothetical protein
MRPTAVRFRRPSPLARLVALAAPAIVGLAFGTPAAVAQLDPAVELRVDLFQGSFDSSLRLDSREFGVGTELDLEQDLGLEEDVDEVRAELLFRTGDQSRLTIDYMAFDRSAAGPLGRPIRVGDFVFVGDIEVASSVESQFVALGWRYDFLAAPESELGLSFSVAWLTIESEITGSVRLGGTTFSATETGDAEGPVPMLGLHGAQWFGDRFRLSGAVRYLEISDLDGWSGSTLDYGARFDWFFLENLGVGVGWSGTDIEAEFDDQDDLGRADYAYDGVRAGLTVAF